MPTSAFATRCRVPRTGGESACKPGSVVNSHSSGTCVTARLKRPTRKHARARAAALWRLRLPYLALLQVGFAMPSRVATDAVRSYRTVSPLPALLRVLRRSTLCCTFRGLTPPRYYLAPCPPSPDFPPRRIVMKRSDCPADSPPRHLSMTLNRQPPHRAAAAPAGRRRCAWRRPAGRRSQPRAPAAAPAAAVAALGSAARYRH